MAIERSAISERTSRIAFSFSSRIRPGSLFHLQTGFGGSFPVSFVDDLFLFGKCFFQDGILFFLCFGKYPGPFGLDIGKLFIRLASRFKRVVDVGFPLFHCLDDDRKSVFGKDDKDNPE